MVLLIIYVVNLPFVPMSAWDKLSICFDFSVTCQPVFDNALKPYTKDSYLYLLYSYGDIRLYRLHLTGELTSSRVSFCRRPCCTFIIKCMKRR